MTGCTGGNFSLESGVWVGLILEEDDLTGQWRLEMSGDVDSFQPHLTKL